MIKNNVWWLESSQHCIILNKVYRLIHQLFMIQIHIVIGCENYFTIFWIGNLCAQQNVFNASWPTIFEEAIQLLHHSGYTEYSRCSILNHPNQWHSHRNEEPGRGKHNLICMICSVLTYKVTTWEFEYHWEGCVNEFVISKFFNHCVHHTAMRHPLSK